MMEKFDSRTKAAGIVLAVVVAIVLIQMTSMAFLPASTNDFVRGFAIGLGIVFLIALFTSRNTKSNS